MRQLSNEELVSALIAKVAEELAELNPEEPDFKRVITSATGSTRPYRINRYEWRGRTAPPAGFAKRGGFLDGQYISALHLRPDDPWVNYYRKRPSEK